MLFRLRARRAVVRWQATQRTGWGEGGARAPVERTSLTVL